MNSKFAIIALLLFSSVSQAQIITCTGETDGTVTTVIVDTEAKELTYKSVRAVKTRANLGVVSWDTSRQESAEYLFNNPEVKMISYKEAEITLANLDENYFKLEVNAGRTDAVTFAGKRRFVDCK